MPDQTVNDPMKPNWLTKDYVQFQLRKYFQDEKIELQKLEIKPGTAMGENYASVMIRINADYKNAKKQLLKASFLLKTTFQSQDPAEIVLKPYGVYTREMDMYERILPKLTLLLQSMGEQRKLFAGTVHVDRAKSSIIFEDMSLERYVVASRIDKLNLEHAHLVLERLAQMHAAAAVLNEQEPGSFEHNFDRGFFNKHTRNYEPIMKGLLKALMRSIEPNKELHERYHNKLVQVCEHLMEYGEKAAVPNKTDFLTLTHGDLWTTNMMFQYDANGKPNNAILIDFQFSAWTSPAVDLHYFFNTSLTEELRLHRQTELVQYYYYKLVKALKELKFSGHIPSLFEFHMQFRARAFYGVFSAFIFQPVMIYTGNEEATIESCLSDAEKGVRFRNDVYQNDVMQKNLQNLLPIFDQLGLLDDMP